MVIGYTDGDAALFETGRVFVTGRFIEAEVADLVQREGCHVAFYPSVAPETWSYALTHGLRFWFADRRLRLGRDRERLKSVARARLVPVDTGPADMNAALIAAAPSTSGFAARRGRAIDAVDGAEWVRLPDDAWIEAEQTAWACAIARSWPEATRP